MPAPDDTLHDLKRLHRWFAVSALAVLAATAWMVLADHGREWKRYQQGFRGEIEPGMGAIGIHQIWLPDLTINYNFSQVARFDRCTTCHLGIEGEKAGSGKRKAELRSPAFRFPPSGSSSQPFRAHPRLDLFVGASSPHPAAEFGCTICHDGQGSATEFQFASHSANDMDQGAQWREMHGWSRDPDWDFRMRPRRFAESNCLKCHHDVVDLEPSRRFPDPPAPKLLSGYHLVRQYGCFGCHEIRGIGPAGGRVGPDMRLARGGASALVAAAGASSAMPKVGPSLRHIAGKLDAATLQSWIAEPARLRPSTRMPRFFGMHEHLDGTGLDDARRFEPIEIRAIAEYLISLSQPVTYLPTPPKTVPPSPVVGRIANPSYDRGKRDFLLQGCLACHGHADFSEAHATQGPDLSQLRAKLTTPSGKSWLASWIRDPSRHSPRTLMPNPLLTAEAAGDIAAYLLAPAGPPSPEPLPPLRESDLDALAALYLTAELAPPGTLEAKLRYVGRQTIRRRGCFGCHDIAGFEDAEPIGPAISDWGRKQESLLAFGQVYRFLESSATVGGRSHVAGGELKPHIPPTTYYLRSSVESPADRAFYLNAVRTRRREGFLWQKLSDPRSFDYMRAEKGYREHLLMGRFALMPAEREAIMTFVLGLVAEAPKEKYLPRFEPRRMAIVEGRKVLDKYACAQCHTLEMESWTVDFSASAGGSGNMAGGESKPHVPPTTYQLPSHLVGMPQRTADGKLEQTEDEDGNTLYAFQLWKPATIDGKLWPVGGAAVLIKPGQIVRTRPPRGGDFARLLLPAVLAEAKGAGSTTAPDVAWEFVPPPLIHTGEALQPAWLHDYLLEPSVIRPAAVLHMPKYNLSTEEAGKLANYFAAASGSEFPFDSDPRGRAARQAGDRPAEFETWQKAYHLILDQKTFCAKCHLIGDWRPGGATTAAGQAAVVGLSGTTLAPNLERVAARIRPEYLRRWIANPKAILPYTPMPVNFPVGQALGQDLLPGSSAEQLDAVSDFLLNYDTFMRRRTSMGEPMRKETPD